MKRRVIYLGVGALTLAVGVVLAKLFLFVSGEAEVAGVETPPVVESAALGDYRVSGPYAHGNLAVFLVHGADALPGWSPTTLEEAVGRGLVVVSETGEVNELSVENRSGEEVFAQAGDIVKGGRQDRTLAFDLILPPHSGAMPLDVFCVEHGRWTPRPGESQTANAFTMREMIASKDLKMAVKD